MENLKKKQIKKSGRKKTKKKKEFGHRRTYCGFHLHDSNDVSESNRVLLRTEAFSLSHCWLQWAALLSVCVELLYSLSLVLPWPGLSSFLLPVLFVSVSSNTSLPPITSSPPGELGEKYAVTEDDRGLKGAESGQREVNGFIKTWKQRDHSSRCCLKALRDSCRGQFLGCLTYMKETLMSCAQKKMKWNKQKNK